MNSCAYCSTPITQTGRGRERLYCSIACARQYRKLRLREGRPMCACRTPYLHTPFHCECGRWKTSTYPRCEECMTAVERAA